RNSRAGCVDCGQTEIAVEGIRTVIGEVFNIVTTAVGVVHGDLHWGIADDSVCSNRITLDARRDEDSIRIPYDLVLFDRVVGIDGSGHSDAKVISLSCITISY